MTQACACYPVTLLRSSFLKGLALGARKGEPSGFRFPHRFAAVPPKKLLKQLH